MALASSSMVAWNRTPPAAAASNTPSALTPAHLVMHAAWLALLNYAWPIVDPERAFLHDRIAGTRIVAEPRVPKG